MMTIARQLPIKRKRYDLPLQRGSGGQLVMLIVGVMTFLMALFAVTSFGLNQVQTYWASGITGKMTIEIPYQAQAPVQAEQISKMVTALNKLKGVTAKALTDTDMQDLVGPWLGTSAELNELPLPKLVDITRQETDQMADNALIEKTAKSIIPTASLDTHQEWLADIVRLAKTLRMILLSIALILTVTSAVTVAATARTRLALHREEVDLLHLIGATDSYIATQFQRQAFRLATEGSVIGLVLAFITMAGIGWAKNNFGDGLIPNISLSGAEWLMLCLLPLFAGLIAMIASRITILRALKELP
jgi:cell division transport system permease protein